MNKQAMKLYNIYNNTPEDKNIWEWFTEYLEAEKKAVRVELVNEMNKQLKYVSEGRIEEIEL